MRKLVNSQWSYIIVTLIFSILILISSSYIFEGGFLKDRYGEGIEYYKGKVISIQAEDLDFDEYIKEVEIGYQDITVKVLEGPYKGTEYSIRNNISRLYNFKVNEGSKVILSVDKSDADTLEVSIYNYDRSGVMYVLSIIFILVVIAIGGIKGVKSLVALIFTLVSVVFLMIPLMLRGANPIVVAIVISILCITLTLSLISGINKKTITAILGTSIGVIIAGVLAYIFGKLSNLSGINMTDTESLIYISETTGLKIKGLLFSGILVASLGAVMDIAMSISSSIFELDLINKKMKSIELFKSAMNIGRDMIGTMTNTLILAFAGGSLSTLILIFSAKMPYNKLANLDVLCVEIIQGISGSIGIVLAIPITTAIGVYFCKKKN